MSPLTRAAFELTVVVLACLLAPGVADVTCPPDWVHGRDDARCYAVFKVRVNHTLASAYCRNFGASLVDIQTTSAVRLRHLFDTFRRSRDGFLSERRCRCQAFWLSISHRRSSDSSWTDDVRTNSNADSSTNVVSWRRRQRCPVARVSKLTSDGMWTTQHAYEQCSSTNCFACCRPAEVASHHHVMRRDVVESTSSSASSLSLPTLSTPTSTLSSVEQASSSPAQPSTTSTSFVSSASTSSGSTPTTTTSMPPPSPTTTTTTLSASSPLSPAEPLANVSLTTSSTTTTRSTSSVMSSATRSRSKMAPDPPLSSDNVTTAVDVSLSANVSTTTTTSSSSSSSSSSLTYAATTTTISQSSSLSKSSLSVSIPTTTTSTQSTQPVPSSPTTTTAASLPSTLSTITTTTTTASLSSLSMTSPSTTTTTTTSTSPLSLSTSVLPVSSSSTSSSLPPTPTIPSSRTSTTTTTTTTTTTPATTTSSVTSKPMETGILSVEGTVTTESVFTSTKQDDNSTTPITATAFPLVLVIAVSASSGTAIIILIFAIILVVCLTRRRRTNKSDKAASSRRQASSDNFYSVRCEPGGVERHADAKTPTVDDNGYETIGLPTRTPQTSAESRPRVVRRPPLPMDRRSLSMQNGAVGGVSGSAERSRVPATRFGSRSAVSSVSGVDADVRQLIDELLELKRLLEEYVVSGVHLELSFTGAEATARPWRSQNEILRSVGDVSARVGDVMRQLSGDTRRSRPTPALAEPRTVQLTAPGYLVEQLAALRPRLDRLIAVIGTVAAPPDSPLRRLETTLVNVRAGIDMTVDTIADNFPYRHALLPAVHGNHRRPAMQTATDGYERVRRPNRSGVIRRRSRPVGLFVDASDGDQEIWSLLDPLSVVCCRLQTLVEARSDGRPTTTGGDVRWQAGLLASVDWATQRLQLLATSNGSTAASRNTSDISSSFTSRGSIDDDTVLMRRLRDGDGVFGDLLAERLRSFLEVAEGLHPVAFNRLARRRSSSAAGHPWGTATANFVRDLRGDAIQLARIILRSSSNADRGRGRSVTSGRSRAASTASSRPGGESLHGSGSVGPSSAATATSAAGSQRSDRSSRRTSPLAAPSTLASIPDLRDVDSSTSSPLYAPGSDLSFVTTSRGTDDDDEDNQFEVLIDRTSDTFVDSLFDLYDKTPLELMRGHQLNVTFVGEAGIDGGAVSREFFFIVFEALLSRPICGRCAFQGVRGHLLPTIDHTLTERRVFRFVGVLVVQAARRGCRGLPGLCDAVRHFLAAGARISAVGRSLALVSLDDVADLELRAILDKLQQGAELDDDEQLVLERWLDEAKFSRVLKPSTHREAIQRVLCHYVFDSRMSQLQAIAEGMAEMGFQPGDDNDIGSLFPKDVKLTVSDFMSGIAFDDESHEVSEDLTSNNNYNTTRKRTKEFFRKYIDDVYNGKVGKLTLEDVLQFINGAPYFASMTAVIVHFADTTDSDMPLPRAHACSSELVLPTVHRSYRDFRTAMTSALELSSQGFGIA